MALLISRYCPLRGPLWRVAVQRVIDVLLVSRILIQSTSRSNQMSTKKTLMELAMGANLKFAPSIEDAFPLVKAMNPDMDLTALDSESLQALQSWFNKYWGIQVTQVSNLRQTITSPVKHLALDLVVLTKGGSHLDRAGLSSWCSVTQAPNETQVSV